MLKVAQLLRQFAWLPVLLLGTPARAGDEIQVTVIAILASDQDTEVNPKLKAIATEVQKREPALTGYRMDRSTTRTVKFDQKEIFPLVEKTTVAVTVHKDPDKDGKIVLTIKPPTLGEITYACKCGKYFPVVTRHITQEKKRLIVALMCEPCRRKEGDK